jgi:uncharacterized membrane protein
MTDVPLHPLFVHFPIALVTLLPLAAIVALVAIRRGAPLRLAWAVPAILSVLLLASTLVAIRTGEADEDAVERVVGERLIEEHEEAAERFAIFAGAVTLVTALGLLRSGAGRVARPLAAVAAIGLFATGIQLGHSGGELVYRHGAANAYHGPPSFNPQPYPHGE